MHISSEGPDKIGRRETPAVSPFTRHGGHLTFAQFSLEPNDALHTPGPASFSGLGKQQSLTGPSVICNAGFPTTSYTSSLLGLLPPIIWMFPEAIRWVS